MKLLLAIETSSDEYRAVLGCGWRLLFDSALDSGSPTSRDMATLVSHGLRLVGAEVREVAGVTLNIGPGGLSYVRAGVAFVNALAFSLGIPIYPFNFFEIIASEARKQTELPVLCAVPAANDHAYVGLVNGASVEVMRFGPLPSTVATISEGLTEVAVAGRIRHRVSSLLNRVRVIDTGIEKPDASVLFDLGYRAFAGASTPATQVSPLNDEAGIFYE